MYFQLNDEDKLPDDVNDNIEDYNYDTILIGEYLESPFDIPITNQWIFPFMYDNAQDGSIRVWKIGFNPYTNQLIRRHGVELTTKCVKGGELQTEYKDIVLNQSNRNIQEQALLEARQFYKEKHRKGYRHINEKPLSKIKPQRAPPIIDKKTGKWKLNDSHYKNGVSCQAKLDGVRGLAWSDNIDILSREGIKYKWLQNIKTELSSFFIYLPECGLDGELYNQNMTCSQIQSAATTIKYEHINNKKLGFYIFDIILTETILIDRINILYNGYKRYLDDGNINKYFFILPQIFVYTQDDLNKQFNKYIKEGYEGMMIRKLVGQDPTEKELRESWYREKKNNSLLKMKSFLDTEGIVVEVESGIGRNKGTAKFIVEWNGKRFGCQPGGSQEKRKEWYDNKDKYIGKIYKFKYFELSEYGVPRFPTGIMFREEDFKHGDGIITNIKIYEEDKITHKHQISIFELLITDNVKIYCIPSGNPKEHKLFLDNIQFYTGKKYKYRYMCTLKDDITPENPIGYGFIL